MSIFTQQSIRLGIPAQDQRQFLQAAAELGAEQGILEDVPGVVAAMLDREKQSTTALMDGVAIPHAKHEAIRRPGVLVLRSAAPVEWTSGESVGVGVALLVPGAEAGTTHLQILSRVARALMNKGLRETLNGGTEAEIHEALGARLDA